MKPVKEKIRIIDLDRGHFECKNSCNTCKKNCKLIKEIIKENGREWKSYYKQN